MSISQERFKTRSTLEESPEFELECLFDDAEDPRELTIFSPNGTHASTEWITIEKSAAIPIDEIR